MTPQDFQAARISLGLSVAELADILAVDRTTVTRWEAGTRKIHPTACVVMGWLKQGKDLHKAGYRVT